MAKLSDIEGIGQTYAEKLQTIGVGTQEQLLQQAGDPKGRQRIAQDSGISEKLILEWANRADLARVKGVGEEYADLLENSGVDTVRELAQRNAKNLYGKILEVNEQKKLVRSTPSESQIEKWVEQAKLLPPGISH